MKIVRQEACRGYASRRTKRVAAQSHRCLVCEQSLGPEPPQSEELTSLTLRGGNAGARADRDRDRHCGRRVYPEPLAKLPKHPPDAVERGTLPPRPRTRRVTNT
jgi:hypothetical protein